MYNNEEIGVSAEIAIADYFQLAVDPAYRLRGRQAVIESILSVVEPAFRINKIPRPLRHVAAGQNPVDFSLVGGQTLSVKTNQKKLGKVAPQKVGQASSKTFFLFFSSIFSNVIVPQDYPGRVSLFKSQVFISIDKMLAIYWANLFDCDFLIYLHDILDKNTQLAERPGYIVLSKRDSPDWDINQISFTKSLLNWNESNTVKYHGVTIGEFQIHNNRDNFKFRFNMAGLEKLNEQGII